MTTKLSDRSKLLQADPKASASPAKARSETVLVTPELARKWLEENMKTNRPCSDRTVKGYAVDMAAGRWQLNGESIKFDVDENLIDGQHRLWACVESNCSFRTVVTWDLPKTAFATIDTGKKRSASDAMHLAGMGMAHKTSIAAAIRAVIAYRNKNEIGSKGVPNATILDFLRDEPGIAEIVTRVRHSLGKPLNGMTSPVAAVLYTASRTISIDEFLDKLGSGEGLTKGSAILTLRNKLLSAGSGSGKDARERFWSVVVAWNAYVEGRQMQVIRIPQDPPRIKGEQ